MSAPATFEVRLVEPDGYTADVARGVDGDEVEATVAVFARAAVPHAAAWGLDASGYRVQVFDADGVKVREHRATVSPPAVSPAADAA